MTIKNWNKRKIFTDKHLDLPAHYRVSSGRPLNKKLIFIGNIYFNMY